MRERKKKVLIVLPESLLKKIDALAKKAGSDRSAFIAKTLDAKFFDDEMREANP